MAFLKERNTNNYTIILNKLTMKGGMRYIPTMSSNLINRIDRFLRLNKHKAQISTQRPTSEASSVI